VRCTLKKLTQRMLVKVEWYTKRASVFTVFVRQLVPSRTIDLGMTPKLYDLFEEEDRALFLSCKHSLSPKELKEIEEDAGDYYRCREGGRVCVCGVFRRRDHRIFHTRVPASVMHEEKIGV
jgi:hypothetical protein